MVCFPCHGGEPQRKAFLSLIFMDLRTGHLLKGKMHLISTGFIWQESDSQAEGKAFHGVCILLSFTAKFINEAKRSTTQATSEVLEGQHILQRGPATKDNKIPKGENGPTREVGGDFSALCRDQN